MALESLSDEIFLLLHCDVVEDSLNRVSTLLVTADFDEIVLNQLKNS